MPQATPIIILGGRSLVAPYLMHNLASAGLSAEVISRQSLDLPAGFRPLLLDLAQARQWCVPEGAIVISLVPIWILAQHMLRFVGAQSIIAVSSTSRYSKADSNDPKERTTAENLEMAENILQTWGHHSLTPYTILRPTLIYDGATDQNVTRMARTISRFGIFPVASPGNGLRQPIHADDVALAIMAALGNATVYNKSLNLAGGEILTYRQMVERVFEALDLRPRPLMLPTNILQRAFQIASKLGVIREKSFGFSVFKRMNEDLVFDVREGIQLLKLAPRAFYPAFSNS